MSKSNVVVIDTGKNNELSIAADVKADPKRKFSIVIRGNNNKVIIRAGTDLQNTVVQILGSNCTLEIAEHSLLQNGNLILDHGSSIFLGRYTRVANPVIRAEYNTNIRMGERCMISSDTLIRTTDEFGIFDIETQQMINPAADIVIGDHVWMGIGAKVGRGTVVGTGSIIGLSSYATGTLDPYCIYAGCPARKVKEGISWSPNLTFDLIPDEYKFGMVH